MSVSCVAAQKTASVGPVKLDKGSKTLTIKEVTYSYVKYEVFYDYYDTVTDATWVVVIPQPESINWYDGDYMDIYVNSKERYVLFMDDKIFEFDSNGYTVRDMPENYNYEGVMSVLGCSYYGDEAFEDGCNISYVYAQKGEQNYVIVYGNELSYK